MRNLKKAGAVALAAVMAVTFAPVASLQVFAANTKPSEETSDHIGKLDTTGTIDEAGRYKITATSAGVTITVEKNATVDLNGTTVTTTNAPNFIVKKGATLTLTDSAPAYGTNGQIGANVGDITLGNGGDNSDDKDDTEAGNVIITKSVAQATGKKINIVKGAATVNNGSVTQIEVKKLPAVNGATTDQDVKGLRGKSSITINGGSIGSITFEETNVEAVIEGKDALRASAGITINGGEVEVLPVSSNNAYEYEKGKNGNFVNITGGVFKTNFDSYHVVNGFTQKYLNSTSEKALPIAVDDMTNIGAGLTGASVKYYVGNSAIQNAIKDGKTITVLNGDAVVSGIGDTTGVITNYIDLSDASKTLKGTLPTVTATAANGVSLLNIDTKKIPTGNAVVVEQTEYHFGWLQVKGAIEGLGAVTGCDEYQRKLDVQYAADAKDGKYDLSNNTNSWATTTNEKKAATDLTYFTNDPSDRVVDGTEVGLIDGTYYVIGAMQTHGNATHNAYANAVSSVKILKTDKWATKTSDTTENQNAWETFNVKYSVAANVTGPEDTNVVIYNPTVRSLSLVNGEVEGPTATAYVFGKDVAVGTINVNDTPAIDGVNTTAAQYIVNGVVGDEIEIDNVDEGVKIVTADGLDWYTENRVNGTNDQFVYHFAKSEKANEDFKNKLLGYTSKEGVKVDPTITGAVRVSTGISGEYEGVTTGVNIDAEWAGGEQTSDLAADKKSRTWYVNFENKNVPQNVYRLRAKVGNNHLFTMDKDEADNAVASGDWVLENTNSFKMLPWNTNVKGAVKVLRFRNVRTNEFLYTTDPTEQANLFASADWAEGNVAFCGLDPESKEGYPVTRLNSLIGQGHLYSTAKKEVDNAVENDFYKQEGVAFWAVETPEKEK